MATAAVVSQPPMPKPHFKPIIHRQTAKRKLDNVAFDPTRHIAFQPPESIMMLKDIGFEGKSPLSPVAASQPFRMFSAECIEKFRDEVLSDDVMKNCSHKSNLSACQLRGYAPKYAPFIFDAWHHPETLAIVSKIAGVDLIPALNYEIGHVNISVKSEKEASDERAIVQRERDSHAADEGIAGCPWEDDKPIVGWHNDSYPFVCVVMLSDCTNMIGGETALRTADGSVIKVRGPEMGCAVVMQGRYITHQALRALGAQERIAMVTSFRPKSPFLPDDTVMTTIRGISDLSEVYYEYGRYRLEILEERIRAQLKQTREAHTAGKKTNTRAIKSFLAEQEAFIQQTDREIVNDDEVVAGFQPVVDIPDVKLPTPPAESGQVSKRVKV
ncbi:hypothetical protein BAUCODRAFT_316286 [Baudoinia panamericana UAMH 10762]|uniref:Fe2OG dioxygenase domain-containing protein n=1 Tax=Baudoinia panamericana (strain UAMH 10762) TaxID=717646 RepID=M2LBE0_BAUPA|nr:uncharacterized protein BAUCODRAFT_316286 [Baudoinia panamericana UAMH 10762]EMC91152.1 hypothetical protein BAUCODRAFT_316286 [Baudoinia panamericana UAMH 10762]